MAAHNNCSCCLMYVTFDFYIIDAERVALELVLKARKWEQGLEPGPFCFLSLCPLIIQLYSPEHWARWPWTLGMMINLTVTWTSVFAWKIPWAEETGGLPSVRLQSRTQLSDWAHTSTVWTTRAKDRAYGFTCIILFNAYDDPIVTSSFINRVLFLVVGEGCELTTWHAGS